MKMVVVVGLVLEIPVDLLFHDDNVSLVLKARDHEENRLRSSVVHDLNRGRTVIQMRDPLFLLVVVAHHVGQAGGVDFGPGIRLFK